LVARSACGSRFDEDHCSRQSRHQTIALREGIYPPDRTPKRRVLAVDARGRPMVGARG
jgi:hypothetical protein